MALISDNLWREYEEQGYLKLGKLLPDRDLKALSDRINQIMMGEAELDYSRILMQLDSESGKYEDAGVQSKGHKGATLNYRKIQDLEYDAIFLEFMQRPIFEEICDHVYGPSTPIAAFRAMFMNKPAGKGTFLPWHQDRWINLDRDPLVTIWTAIDPATKANGCVQIVPGSHKKGLINASHPSGFLELEQAKREATPDKIVYLELAPGEVALLHNWLLHASDVNRTDHPRRAFSVCYMDAHTQSTPPEKFNTVFGEGAMRVGDLQPVATGQ